MQLGSGAVPAVRRRARPAVPRPAGPGAGRRARPSWSTSAAAPAISPRTLADRWPGARLGVDSSPEMLAAGRHAGPRRRASASRSATCATGQPDGPVDVLVSNATLQWVPGPPRPAAGPGRAVAPGGWLAFQVPGNFGDRSHTAMAEVATSPRWQDRFDGRDRARPAVEQPAAYLDRLAGLGCAVDAWETTYLHVLQGPDAVRASGSGHRAAAVLQALADDERAGRVRGRLPRAGRGGLPEKPCGTVLPFRRIFVVAQRAVQS